ncbi:MAG: uridine kinase [Nocardioidaceae bacterium]|nr:uridine kinase [Nocardioidaceae bacterium]
MVGLVAQVVVVAGPSGSGKSRLCRRLEGSFGMPAVNLDDFYKDGDDPTLPRLGSGAGQVDWDDPASWSCEEALDALERLCRTGVADVPVYDISRDGRTGLRRVSLGGAPYFLAEGLFAQEVIGGCRARGLLADAVCVRNPRLVTFWRRLSRDLREHRKPPMLLLRRGWRLMRAEPAVVAHAVACGAAPMRPQQAFERIRRQVRGTQRNIGPAGRGHDSETI